MMQRRFRRHRVLTLCSACCAPPHALEERATHQHGQGTCHPSCTGLPLRQCSRQLTRRCAASQPGVSHPATRGPCICQFSQTQAVSQLTLAHINSFLCQCRHAAELQVRSVTARRVARHSCFLAMACRVQRLLNALSAWQSSLLLLQAIEAETLQVIRGAGLVLRPGCHAGLWEPILLCTG